MSPPTTATGAFFRRLRYSLERWEERHSDVTFGLTVGLLTFALLSALILTAHAHDWKRPDLDGWYGSLRNPNSHSSVIKSIGCCSKDDCHETEAEMRGNDWWARLGSQHRVADENGDHVDWELVDWVKVPSEAILLNQPNPTGNAVICHSITRVNSNGTQRIDPAASTVFCFIPPTES